MNWRTCFLFLGVILIGTIVPAQVFNRPSEMVEAVRVGENKLLVGFDTRRSFIDKRDVRLLGLRAGLDFDKKVRLGFGVYFLGSGVTQTFIFRRDNGPDTLKAPLRFAYITFFAEPVFLSTKRWEVSTPFHLGVGESFYEGPRDLGFRTNQTVFLAELSLVAQYKILPWVGIGGGFGYRQMLVGNPYVKADFNAGVYMINVKIFLGYLYRKLMGREP